MLTQRCIHHGRRLKRFTYKQTLSRIRLPSCTSLSSSDSDGAQTSLGGATLRLSHGRRAVMLLMNGWTSGRWPPFRCMECLVLGGWREVAKLFRIYKLRSECGWEVRGKAFGGSGHQSDGGYDGSWPLCSSPKSLFDVIMKSRPLPSSVDYY